LPGTVITLAVDAFPAAVKQCHTVKIVQGHLIRIDGDFKWVVTIPRGQDRS
jgi:hypothetical protein